MTTPAHASTVADLESVTGRIFDIQSFSIHDGPGIRTTIFLKGCPLRCLWCHNPESMEARRDIRYLPAKCLFCSQCVEACEHDGHRIEGDTHEYDRDACVRCGVCIEGCPTGALEIAGRETTAGEAVELAGRDKMFYERSGGGITLSGGEPMLQPEFTRAVLQLSRDGGFHCAVDTCGYAPAETVQSIVPMADLVLFDLKALDDDLHRRLTGVSNELVIANLREILSGDDGPPVWLRFPLIPGCTDDPEDVERMATFVGELWGNPRLEQLNIMPYHRLAESKYEQFGRDYTLTGTDAPSEEDISAVADVFAHHGVEVTRE